MWIPKPKFVVPSGAIMIVLFVCSIYPFIIFFDYLSYCSHKNQVVIEQTNFEGSAWRDDGYIGGTDYLNFSVEVSFKNKEVAYVEAHTLVFKGEKFIGHIQSRFEGTAEKTKDRNQVLYFEPNTTQKLYFHIKHPTNHSWEGYEVFKELYYGNINDYTIITNVISVTFTNLVVVGHKSYYYYDEDGTIYFKDENSLKEKYYYYDSNGKKHYV
jgi:hypothetical protein